MGDLIGYARVSTADQNLDGQVDALTAAGCARIFSERASGARDDRPQLAAALDYLRAGDTLVVYRLDRLGRRTKALLQLIEDLEDRDVGFRSLAEGFDPSTALGKALVTVAAAFAEMERNLTIERTRVGLAAARARGRVGGRKRKMSDRQIANADTMLAEVDDYGRYRWTVAQVASEFDVSRATIYRHCIIPPTADAS